MAIQKFKYGQEITSAKLNEIVSFLNTLETALSNTQYWNNSVDNKISGFTTQLNALKTQVTSVLGSANTLDSIRQQIAVIEAQYASLIEENVTSILTDLFDNVSITAPDENGVSYWVINNEVTTIKAGIKGDTGPAGATGAAGASGTNGTNGNTIITGSTDPGSNIGVLGDLYLNTSSYSLFKKESVNNSTDWVFKNNIKGTIGPTGKSIRIDFGFKDFDGQATLNFLPGVSTKYLSFRTYEVFASGQVVPNSYSQFYTIKIRGDRWFPRLTTSGEVVNLEWILDDGNSAPSLAAVNIRGPQGPQGPTGASGNNFIVKGIVSSDANLPNSGVAGDAYMVGASAPYAVYIWNLNKAGGAGWSSIGTGIVGPTGATGPAGAAGQNGSTGQRGNKIFAITSLPTVSPYNDLGLITNDIFINKNTGLISEITAVANNVPTYADVTTLPIVDELVFETQIKAIEPLAIGDVVQFAGVHDGQKLVAKATPFNNKSITFQNTVYPIANFNLQPEVIMGISRTTVASAGNQAQIVAFGYINNWPEESLSLTSNDIGKILFVKSEGTLEEDRGKLTLDRPADKTKVTLPIAAFIALSGNNLLVRSWITATVAGDVAGLSALLDQKVTKNNNITAATKTKITYDAKGLVTAGTDIVAGDITSGTFAIGQIPTGTTNTTVSLGNHTHGNLSSDGKIGANTVSGRLVMTTTNGALTTQDRYTTVYTTGTPLQVTSATFRDLTLTQTINKFDQLKITWSNVSSGNDFISECYIVGLTSASSDGAKIRISQDLDPEGTGEGVLSFSIQLGTTTNPASGSTIRVSSPSFSYYTGTTGASSIWISKIERINF